MHAQCALICPTHACSDLRPYFLQAIGVFDVVCYKYNLCAPIRMTWCVFLCQRLKRICRKLTGPMTWFGCHIAFMFPWMRALVCVCVRACVCVCVHGSACARSVMLIFALLNVFHTRHEEYFPTTLSCTIGEPVNIAIFAPSVPHGWFCTQKHVFFLLIDRTVCIIQNTHILDVFITYIANMIFYIVAN